MAPSTPSASAAPRDEVRARLENWRRRAGAGQAPAIETLMADPRRLSVLLSVFEQAPALSALALAHPDAVIEALGGGADHILDRTVADLAALDRVTGPVPALSRAIAPLKERAVTALAFADLAGLKTTEETGIGLARLADAVTGTALDWLVRLAIRHGELKLEEGATARVPGLFLIGARRLAGREPGYWGPIELAFVMDDTTLPKAGLRWADRAIERLAGDLCDCFDGLKDSPQIFRVAHVRRFSPSARTLVIPARTLQEMLAAGEPAPLRAFLAGARVVAGDREAGEAFLAEARRTIFEAPLGLAELSASVHPKRPPSEGVEAGIAALEAHLGRLTDVCRLALGTDHPGVRDGSAISIFREAERIGALDPYTVDRLAGLAAFTARAVHRLQLIRGSAEPSPPQGLERVGLAALCGFSNADLFFRVVDGALAEFEQLWTSLMSEGRPARLGAAAVPAAPASGERLQAIGFARGQDVGTTVDRWLAHRRRSREGAPERLSALVPGLLTALGATRDPDGAIAALDAAIANAPPSIDPLARLRDAPALVPLIADLFGNAGETRDVIAGDPMLIAEAFNAEAHLPAEPRLWLERFAPPLASPRIADLAPLMAAYMRENRARLALGVLRGELDPLRLPALLQGLTDAAIAAVTDTLSAERRAGEGEPGRGLAVVAYGSYGTGTLGLHEPVGLGFVFDPDGEDGPTAGGLSYYSGLAADIVRVLNGERTDGRPIVRVDPARRPGGAEGEAALSLRVFRNQFMGEVGACDLLALGTARSVCGTPALVDRVSDALAELVTRPRKAARFLSDAHRLRAQQDRPEAIVRLSDIETVQGGLDDLSRVIEALRLREGADHPYILNEPALSAFDAFARARCIEPDAAEALHESLVFFVRLKTMLSVVGDVDLRRAPPARRLAELLSRAAGVADFKAVVPLAKGHADCVSDHYRRIFLTHDTVPSLRSPEAA